MDPPGKLYVYVLYWHIHTTLHTHTHTHIINDSEINCGNLSLYRHFIARSCKIASKKNIAAAAPPRQTERVQMCVVASFILYDGEPKDCSRSCKGFCTICDELSCQQKQVY